MKPSSEMTIPFGWSCNSARASAGNTSTTPQALAESIGMDALCEAFRNTMLTLMQVAFSTNHEETRLECLKEAKLCVERFHASADLLMQLAQSAANRQCAEGAAPSIPAFGASAQT